MTAGSDIESLEKQRHGSARFRLAICAVLAFALIQQVIILADGWPRNPLAAAPLLDARIYWDRAGKVATGALSESTPFMGAPAFAYILGLIRAAGGGLLAAAAVQVALHLLTILLIAVVAARQFGEAAAITAAVIYTLLTEAAFYPGRILTCTLQAFLTACVYFAASRAAERRTIGSFLLLGLTAGFAATAGPPMQLAIVLLAAWALLSGATLQRGAAAAAALCISAALVIAPFTIHNFRVAGELIPLSAQAGVTFAQGNNAGAIGIYNVIPGISRDRSAQNLDALRQYRAESGDSGGWNAANQHFFARGREYLLKNPSAAATLIGRKFLWFTASAVYGDIYLPLVERAEGVARALWLAPLPISVLTWPALLAAAALLVGPRRWPGEKPLSHYLPAIILLAVPLITVLMFFYSPRYRFPAAPILAVLAAAGFVRALNWKRSRLWCAVFVIACVGGTVLNLAITMRPGPLHDTVASWRAPVILQMATVSLERGRAEDAERFARRSIELQPADPLAHFTLGQALKSLDRPDAAIAAFRDAIRLDRHMLTARYEAGELLVRHQRIDEGIAELRAAVDAAPMDPTPYIRLAPALAAVGRVAEADELVEKAIALADAQGQAGEAARFRTWWANLKAAALKPR